MDMDIKEREKILRMELMCKYSESYFEKYYLSQGFSVYKIIYNTSRDTYSLNEEFEKAYHGFIREYPEEVKKYLGDIFYNSSKPTPLYGIPDFVCIKGKELFFLEVKSGQSHINKNQKEMCESIKKSGFDIYICRCDISGVDTDFSEIIIVGQTITQY